MKELTMLLLVASAIFLKCCKSAGISLPVEKLGHNYALNFTLNGENFFNVLDTGMADIVTYNRTYEPPSFNDKTNNVTISPCVALSVDSTAITFYGETCYFYQKMMSMDNGLLTAKNLTILEADGIYVQNPILHTWENSTGDFGLSYCYNAMYCTTSAFQLFLAQSINNFADTTGGNTNDFENQTFALDFRNQNSSIQSIASSPSTMQMGGVADEFRSNLTWAPMPSPEANYYHQFILQDLSFCGIPLLGNISRTYPVLVDTGSSCLTLPEELYTHFVNWLDNTTIIAEPRNLPAFSFRMMGINNVLSENMFIPLETLIISRNAIKMEAGAPFITTLDPNSQSPVSQRLCVLQGPSIGNPYSSPAPNIVFGALALQALYFAADYSTYSVALTNKLNESETLFYANSKLHCQAPISCKGAQTYSPARNICKPPRCDQYYFTELDADTQTCVASTAPYYFGIIFLSLIIAMECISFFVSQYSGFLLLKNNAYYGYDAHSNNPEDVNPLIGNNSVTSPLSTGRFSTQHVHQFESQVPLHRVALPSGRYRIGYVTLYLGKMFSRLIDWVFEFASPPVPAGAPASVATNVNRTSATGNNNNNSSMAEGLQPHQHHHQQGVGYGQLRQRGGAVAAEV